MKGRLIFSAVFLLFAAVCHSQDSISKVKSKIKSDPDSKWKFGVSFTPSVSLSSASKSIKPDASGFALDITVLGEKYFKEKCAFYVGLSFNNIGGRFKNDLSRDIVLKSENLVLEGQKSAKYVIQYLTIPVGLKFVTPQYGLLSYYFQGGLLPGIKVGSSIRVENSNKQSFSKDLNLMTCGIQLSPGCLYSVQNDNFVRIGLNFNHFFTDALNSADMSLLSSSFGIVLGYVF